MQAQDIDEIDTCGQFYQRSTSSVYPYRSQKHKKTLKLSIFFVLSGSGRKKAVHRMRMKLTSVVNFINILGTAFCTKKLQSQTVTREKL